MKPVDDAHAAATLPHLPRQVRAIVELQRFTGARPGETCSMRGRDRSTAGEIWEYRPAEHKTAHRGKGRTVFIGPAAREALRPWLRPDPTEHLFKPREAAEERPAAMRGPEVEGPAVPGRPQ